MQVKENCAVHIESQKTGWGSKTAENDMYTVNKKKNYLRRVNLHQLQLEYWRAATGVMQRKGEITVMMDV